ncbi:PREDICTED: protein EFFECTOR OF TRANSCRIPTION 2-like [Nicotiana attenuata]|uniref:Protein effector of transcription 2 n=1 Tax=Nicotiana attenuata TaxID=49451 RepID=A0A314KXS5_NICAT|nr:PREDICTED: protein EFFECTOR OF TRANSCRIPTION 2-like [Nicotiana attenuata]OIT33955.1 protein effector of transcription 2 [Nicotiana attenuata]
MGDTHRSITVRLKREDCKRTKHDSAFSDWKILIGPNDWTDYLLRKEGAEKYRTQNLPNCTSCSGVYELGIAVTRHQAGREASRLDPDYIVPVYVGKSDNVRTRLQRYGREGAHLENGCSNSALHDQVNVSASKRAGLFTEAFSRGFSIVYRWAPMNDNKDAEKTESQLLDRFDYAWNKGSNGVRRHNDVLQKLDGISRATRLPAFVRKLQLSLEKQKGVRIKPCKPLLLENGSDFHDSFKSTYFLPQIFKFGRSKPRIVSLSSGVNGDPNTICGVALGHGSVCMRPPITGNIRCAKHKGMKVNGVNSKLIAEGNSSVINESTRPCASRGEENAPICGFILDGGAPCARKPFQRNKRCLEHKGRRNRGCISQPVTDKNGQSILEYRTYSSNDCHQMLSRRADTQHPQDFSSCPLINQNHNVICGVHLTDGSFCTRQPVAGRKRCEEHKGMRVKEPISKQLGSEIPSVFAGPAAKSSSGKKH